MTTTPLPSLSGLEAFEAAARHGSFVAAAAELHLSPSAVSHRVRSLERALGVPLFVRLARRIELTDHGRSYLPAVRRSFDELARSTSSLFGSVDVEARLTVRAPISFAVRCIAPYLDEFAAAQPHVRVRLVSAIWADTITAEATDLEIRFGHGRWPGLQCQLLSEELAGPVWTPDFAARYGPVESIEDLAARPRVSVLGYDTPGPIANRSSGPTQFTVDTSLAAIELVLTSRYSAIIPLRFAKSYLDNASMLTIPEAHFTMSEAHYIVFPDSTRAPSPEALHFADWLRSSASRRTTNSVGIAAGPRSVPS
jgi:LysR family transcriptional regulator, glycine cleavage system transcriptional activator